MGLGSTAKRLSKVADLAEELYGRVQQLREELAATRTTVDDTNERVADLEAALDEQRALLEAVAAETGVDPETATEDVEITATDGTDAETTDGA